MIDAEGMSDNTDLVALRKTLDELPDQLARHWAVQAETQALLVKVATNTSNMQASFDSITTAFNGVRAGIMERLDRHQDRMSKLEIELETAIALLRDSSPMGLLLRIRQLEEEVRELKGES